MAMATTATPIHRISAFNEMSSRRRAISLLDQRIQQWRHDAHLSYLANDVSKTTSLLRKAHDGMLTSPTPYAAHVLLEYPRWLARQGDYTQSAEVIRHVLECCRPQPDTEINQRQPLLQVHLMRRLFQELVQVLTKEEDDSDSLKNAKDTLKQWQALEEQLLKSEDDAHDEAMAAQEQSDELLAQWDATRTEMPENSLLRYVWVGVFALGVIMLGIAITNYY
ncbi:hypothetical protein ACKC9G_03360 [Pokkaliibacter sp. CJK22405]|uniref:hypothetical protein n=1 Tax=Pokkaliibacter sp. CJK22405 TaxID=3384615 RepID=UPI003984F6A3